MTKVMGLINELVDKLNETENKFNKEIIGTIEFYGDHTDDAEMYIGELLEEKNNEIDSLLEEYSDVSESIMYDSDAKSWYAV